MLVGENVGEFGDLLRIRQSFICQLLVISEKAIGAGLKFVKVFFAKCNLASNSKSFLPPKFFAIRYKRRIIKEFIFVYNS